MSTATRDARPPVVAATTLVVRAVRLAAHLVSGLLVAAVLRRTSSELVRRYVRRWAAVALRIAGVRLVVTGDRLLPTSHGRVLVAEDGSPSAVVALLAAQPVQLVARADVRRWPVFGRIARRHGAIFAGPGLDDLRVLRALVTLRLARGAVVGVLPDADLSVGPAGADEPGRWSTPVLRAARDAGADVRSVTFTYLDAEGRVQPGAPRDRGPVRSVLHLLRSAGTTLVLDIRPLTGLTTDGPGGSARGDRGEVLDGRERVVEVVQQAGPLVVPV